MSRQCRVHLAAHCDTGSERAYALVQDAAGEACNPGERAHSEDVRERIATSV